MSLMRTHTPYYARSEDHTQLAKMSFDNIFDLTAGVHVYSYKIYTEYISFLYSSSKERPRNGFTSTAAFVPIAYRYLTESIVKHERAPSRPYRLVHQ